MLNLYEDNPSGQKAVLDALVRRFPMLSVVSVTNQNGDETVESAANRLVLASDLTNRANTPYFKSGINDETYVGVDNVVGDGTAPNLRIAVPLELYRGKAIGVLSASLSLDDLWDTIRSQRFGKHGFAYITDVRGRPLLAPRHVDGQLLSQSAPIQSVGWKLIVAQPKSDVMQPIQSFQTDISTNTQRSLAQMRADINSASQLATVKLLANAHDLNGAATQRLTVRSSQILQQLQQKTERQFVAEREHMQSAIVSQISDAAVKNNSEMVAAAKAASKNLVVGIPVITSMALERANHRLRFFAAIILAVSCALSCLIGLLLAGVMVKPIILLSQGTRALAMGDLSKRVNERAPAEIGDLAVAFNTMAASLQKSREDLTDAESQLVQSAKLASLGTLSAGVAHELNQPIAIVRGIAQQLKVNTSIDPEVRSDLEIIEGQTSRMMKIVVHLRTFCRTGGYEMVRVDVNQVIRDCFILIEAQLRSHGVAVTLDLCESAPKVLGDPNELEQVFINLITNARDAMNDAPNSMLTIRSYVVGNQVQLEFRDNGPGIPDDVAEHIFDPFFTTKEVGKGTGLGLSISHGLIQKHHGTIVAQNDGGAVFTIAIPATDLQTESESQGADAPMIVRHAA
jgi:C4-dicarboxylate-specific signal transduction histidine kinase